MPYGPTVNDLLVRTRNGQIFEHATPIRMPNIAIPERMKSFNVKPTQQPEVVTKIKDGMLRIHTNWIKKGD